MVGTAAQRHRPNAFMCDFRHGLLIASNSPPTATSLYRRGWAASLARQVDYAMLVKIYGRSRTAHASRRARYSPPECIGASRPRSTATPTRLVSTSFIERQNLTMRMSMRRFTRLTNAFSKKFENHCHSLALYFCWYNWIRKHKTLGSTPAMAAGITDKVPYDGRRCSTR